MSDRGEGSLTQPVRPFDQQSTLEKCIRAELWHPTDALKRANEALPIAVKEKRYADAALLQTAIRDSERDIKRWTEFLALYEAEFNRTNRH